MQAHLYKEPAPVRRYNPSIPAAMEAVVMRAMAKQPAERFQRAGELGAALLSALIADAGDAPTFVLGSSSHGGSRPTGQIPIVMPQPMASNQPRASQGPAQGPAQGAAPPWRQSSGPAANMMSAGASGQASGASAIPSMPAVSEWGAPRSATSLTGILPDLNTPYTSLDAAPGAMSGAGQSNQRGQSGARSGFSGLSNNGSLTSASSVGGGMSGFTDSQATGAMPGMSAARTMGRMPVVPPTFPPASNSAAPLPFEAQPMQPTPQLQPMAPFQATPMATMTQMPPTHATPTPSETPPQAQRADLRATLPGSRMTEPPPVAQPRERRSRLWIIIALLLIVMLIAVVVLLRWLEAGSAGFMLFALH
jgi:serine/threonine-protein kinase